jgi:hypothetical protein
MSDQDEQLYGKEGIEQAQGFTPLQHAVPDEPKEPAIDADSAIAKHLQRPAPPEPVHRDYFDVQSGEATPSNQTLEIDRASRDLSEIRKAERQELESARNAELNEALGWLAHEEEAMRLATTPQPAQPSQPELDPEAIAALPLEQQNALYAANQAQLAEADRQIQEFLKNPEVRERIEGEFNTVKTQAAAEVQQARAAYQHVIAQNAAAGLAALNASFPELAGMTPDQVTGALRLMQPQRAEQYRQHVGLVSNLIAAHQQQAAQQQQQQLALQAQQQQRAAQELEQYRLAEVKRYEAATAHENPETMRTLRESAFPMIERHYGIPEATMRALASGQQRVDSAALLHSSAFQLMITDALKFRMAQQSVGRAASRPIPQVIRPGSSAEAQTRTEAALAEAQAKLKPNMSPKEAAQFLIAKRAAAR